MGLPLAPSLPYGSIGAGLTTDFGSLIPPGAKVAAFVRSSGLQSGDEQAFGARVVTSLQTAMSYCRSGLGDYIFVLPGHTESISSANFFSNMVAGTNIVGLGIGTNRPTFTWTAATATWLWNVANVSLQNCILNMDPGSGTVNVAAPITISAAGCTIDSCQIRMGTDANSKVTIGITTTAAADDLTLNNLQIIGATAAEATTLLQFVGADRLSFTNSVVTGATSNAGVGVIRFLTTASTFVYLNNLIITNNKASSTQAMVGISGLTGFIDNTCFNVLSGGAAAFGTVGSIVMGYNVFASNAVGGMANRFATPETLS